MTYATYTAVVDGVAVPNARVTIRHHSLTSLAVIYDENGLHKPNPVIADASGSFSFGAAPGNYDFLIYDPARQCYKTVGPIVVTGQPHAAHHSSDDDCVSIHPSTRAFLTNAGFLYSGEECDGDTVGCHLNMSVLIASLKRLLPGIDVVADAAQVVDLLDAQTGNATYSLQLDAVGLSLMSGSGSVTTILLTEIATALIDTDASNSLRTGPNDLLFENDVIPV